jgi:hypothetical protein
MLGVALYLRRKNRPRQLTIADLLAESYHPATSEPVTSTILAADTAPISATRPRNTAPIASDGGDPQKEDVSPPPYSEMPRV